MKNQTKQIIGMGYVVFDNSYCKELKYGIDSSLSGLNGVEPRVYIITSMPYREKCYKWREKRYGLKNKKMLFINVRDSITGLEYRVLYMPGQVVESNKG